MKPLKIGDICTVVNTGTRFDGMEGTIVVDLHVTTVDLSGYGYFVRDYFYGVDLSDGEPRMFLPSELVKKPPKQEDTAWAAKKVQDLMNNLPVEAL